LFRIKTLIEKLKIILKRKNLFLRTQINVIKILFVLHFQVRAVLVSAKRSGTTFLPFNLYLLFVAENISLYKKNQ